MRLILIITIAFVAGVWFATKNPSMAHQINAYTAQVMAWIQTFIGR